MTVLRMLRNVAVLVILTVAALSLNPRPVAAQSSCKPLGSLCKPVRTGGGCCLGWCGPTPTGPRCCLFLHNAECTSSVQCCSGFCTSHGCQ
jgi:hypothetical protein